MQPHVGLLATGSHRGINEAEVHQDPVLFMATSKDGEKVVGRCKDPESPFDLKDGPGRVCTACSPMRP